MKFVFKAAAAAAVICTLAGSGAAAQSFEQLTRDGQAAFRKGDFATALDTRLRQLDMKAPNPEDHCFVYWGLFTAYTLGTGEMEKGLKAVNDSIDCLNAIPDNSVDMLEYREEALRYRSNTYRDWFRFDEALAAVDAMDKVRPERAAAHEFHRAIVLDSKGDYEAAAASYARSAQNSDDKDGMGLRYSAWMLVKQGKLDQALSEFAKINRVSPYVPGKSSNMQAWVLVEQGNYQAAVADLQKDEKADSANGTAHAFVRGYVEAARGDFAAATAAFRPAGSTMVNNPTVQVSYYLSQARDGSVSAAPLRALASQLNPAKWPDAQVFYVLGKISRSEFEAAASIGNLRMQQTRQCRVNFVAGEMALVKGDNDAAKTDLARAVELCVFDPAALERTWAKGDLARLMPQPVAAPPATPPAPSSAAAPGTSADGDACAAATAHWTSAESIGTRAAYEDHLARFPNCAFATLAAARIAALDRGGKPGGKAATLPGCAAGMARDADGDCVRTKAERKPAPRRTVSQAPSESDNGTGRPTLDCTTPAGLFACANRALSNSGQ